MTQVPLPRALPTPDQLELQRAKLCELLWRLSEEIQMRASGIVAAHEPAVFAQTVHATAAALGDASSAWRAMSEKIRESWGI